MCLTSQQNLFLDLIPQQYASLMDGNCDVAWTEREWITVASWCNWVTSIECESVLILTPSEFQLLFNTWDKELIQLMLAAEKQCTIFKSGHIPFLPRVGEWIRCINLYWWIQGYKSGKRVNKSNLFTACQIAGIGSPNFMTIEDVQLNEFACIRKTEEIKKHAPEYQQKHLQERLDVARKRKGEKTEEATIRILKRGHDKKKYGRLRVAIGK